jgi:hypothetical protein
MSFTGIGRIGSQHILNLNNSEDTENFLYTTGGSNFWCTHPIKYSVDILDGGAIILTAGSKIVIGSGTLFTRLCADIQMDNKPIWRYVVGFSNGSNNPVVLDVDYVVDDETMVLKFPAVSNENPVFNVYPVDYFNTMILKQVTINNLNLDYTDPIVLELESKFGETIISLIGSRNFNVENEGGVEPLLITAFSEAPPILNY